METPWEPPSTFGEKVRPFRFPLGCACNFSWFASAVETRRLDEMDLGAVGFLKIDVEGHEMAVIAGAAETLRRYRPNLIVEIGEVRKRQPIHDTLEAICGRL